jgi:tRNA (adenine57-N1/adenine58-N1)-methyltransferase
LTENKILEGSYVLLSLSSHKTYLIKVESGKSFHTHKGFVKLDDAIGKDYGSTLKSSLGFEFTALKPLLNDYIMKSARQTQISYPKDIALIVMYSGLGPGSKVVESGTGTGALTTALAHYVRPKGRVYSYEIRKEFQSTAEKNLLRAGLIKYVKLKNKDITAGIDENNVDSVILDLAVPWRVVPHARIALRPSGTIVSFSPTMDQTVTTTEALRDNCFVNIETIECLIRGMQIERGKTRPHTLMTGHTGYVTFARKAVQQQEAYVVRSNSEDKDFHTDNEDTEQTI